MAETLLFPPEKTSYAAQQDSGVIEIPLAGGESRKRQDLINPGFVVNCQWQLEGTEYTEFMGFFESELKYGTEDFLVDLITDIGVPTTHRVRTVGGMPRLTQQSADTYWVTCTLQCDSNYPHTGLIAYFVTDSPDGNISLFRIGNDYEVGDNVRILFSKGIHPVGSTPILLDGIYEVIEVVNANTIAVENAISVASNWSLVESLGIYGNNFNGNVTSTITRVPT